MAITGTKLGTYLATLEEGWAISIRRLQGRLVMEVQHRDGRAAQGHIEGYRLDCAMERIGMADEVIAAGLRELFVRANRTKQAERVASGYEDDPVEVHQRTSEEQWDRDNETSGGCS